MAYEAGHFAEAIALWRPAAEAGSARAQFGLAVAYDLGQGVAKDVAQACLWYRRAGEAGLPEAEFDTALMYDAGRCGAQRPDEAATWYGRAAAHGYGQAQYALARMYEDGHGVPKNLDTALGWYQVAASNGVSEASTRVRNFLIPPSPKHRGRPSRRRFPPRRRGPVPLPRSGGMPFVWQTPQQPLAVLFFVEVADLTYNNPRDVFANYVSRSATLVPLEPRDARYAWRIFAVSRAPREYVASPWVAFDTITVHAK